MNWDYWLPWRNDQREDSTYEEQVIERCEHWPTGWVEASNASTYVTETYVEADHLVFNLATEKAQYCKRCGEQLSTRRVADGKAVVEIDYKVEDGVRVGEALSEPVEEDDGSGRILVNKNDSSDEDDAPLVPIVDEPQADDKPVKAGGATD